MKYLILTINSIDYAKAISKFLYALSVPLQNQTTKYFNNWIQHPSTNEVALVFGEEQLPIHPQADAKLLVNQVRQSITEEEATEMENIINQGGKVKPIDFIPASLGNNILNREKMEADRWFNFEKV